MFDNMYMKNNGHTMKIWMKTIFWKNIKWLLSAGKVVCKKSLHLTPNKYILYKTPQRKYHNCRTQRKTKVPFTIKMLTSSIL
jgi:hypothetical protein